VSTPKVVAPPFIKVKSAKRRTLLASSPESWGVFQSEMIVNQMAADE